MRDKLLDVRARIQSYRSGKFAYGWISSIDPPSITVDLIRNDCFCIGDRYHIEANIGKELVLFDAALKECKMCKGLFRVDSRVRTTRSNENMRLRVSLAATIAYDGQDYPSRIVDVSSDGVGVLTNAPIKRKDRAQIELPANEGSIKLVGQSLYCHDAAEGRWAYRVGLHIPGLDHLVDPNEGDIRRVFAHSRP